MKYLRRDMERVRKIQGWSPAWRNKSHANIASHVALAPWTSWHTDTHYHNLWRWRRQWTSDPSPVGVFCHCSYGIILYKQIVLSRVVRRFSAAHGASYRICFPSLNVFFSTHCSCLCSLLTEWKAPGSFCQPLQQYIKGEQSTDKWSERERERKKMNEWMMHGLHPPRRKRRARTWKTGGRRRGEGRRLTGQIVVQRNESSW